MCPNLPPSYCRTRDRNGTAGMNCSRPRTTGPVYHCGAPPSLTFGLAWSDVNVEWRAEERREEGDEGLAPRQRTLARLHGKVEARCGSRWSWPTNRTRAWRVSAEVETLLPGLYPHTAHMLVVFPRSLSDLLTWRATPRSASSRVLNGGPQVPGPERIGQGVPVTTACTTNCDDLERMLLLKAPAQTPPTPGPPPTPGLPLATADTLPPKSTSPKSA